MRRHLDHQPRGYSDPHRPAGERRSGARVARRQAGEALYSAALWLTYQFGRNLDFLGIMGFFSCGNTKLYISAAFILFSSLISLSFV